VTAPSGDRRSTSDRRFKELCVSKNQILQHRCWITGSLNAIAPIPSLGHDCLHPKVVHQALRLAFLSPEVASAMKVGHLRSAQLPTATFDLAGK